MSTTTPWIFHQARDCGGVCSTRCASCGRAASGKPAETCTEPRHKRLYDAQISRKKAARHGAYNPRSRGTPWTRWTKTTCSDGSFQSARVCRSCGLGWSTIPAPGCTEPRHAARVASNRRLALESEHRTRPPWSIRKRCLSCLGVITWAPRPGCTEPRHVEYHIKRGRSLAPKPVPDSRPRVWICDTCHSKVRDTAEHSARCRALSFTAPLPRMISRPEYPPEGKPPPDLPSPIEPLRPA